MQFIKHLEQEALSDSDLKRMLGKQAWRTKILQYDNLNQFNNLNDMLPNTNDCAIVLLQIQSPGASPVGHWIALINHGDYFEHFDSYGLSMDQELAITHQNKHLSNMMKTTRGKVIQAREKLQSKKEHVNTCGRWCVARILHRELSLQQFTEFVKGINPIPDVAVTLLTMHLGK